MAPKFLGLVFLIVVICNVRPIRSEYSAGNSQYNYNKAKLIQNVMTNFDTTKNLNKLINDPEELLINELKSFTAENLFPIFVDILRNNGSDKCINDLSYVLENIRSQWSLKMLDSFGKPERGLMRGNLHWLGEFDECVNVYAPSNANSTEGDFHGQYCNLQVTANLYGQSLPIKIGVCLPDSCDPSVGILNDILNITNEILPNITSPLANITDIKLTCNTAIKKLSPAAICVIFLLSIFILPALVGSSITAYKNVAKIDTNVASGSEHKKSLSDNEDIDLQSSCGDEDVPTRRKGLPIWIEKVNPFFNCFCMFTNGGKLIDTSSSEGQLPCLHGIRFLSMSWVIVCHIYGMVMFYTREIGNILPAMDHWPFQLMMNGFYCVDSFYLLSGFLLAYLFFEGASKNNGKIPWIYFYVHRYLRITPVYMIVLAFYTTIYPYLSTGPLWTTSVPQCEKYWWRNVLYINNLFNDSETCLGWSWYLSTDMQFFVISPIFLITLWRFPPVGYAIMASFLTATSVANFVISYVYKLPAGLGNIFALAQPLNFIQGIWNVYTKMIYTKPYTRISPYLVGIALAYYLYRRRKNNCSKNSLTVLSAGWIISSTITLACIFGLYHREMSVLEMSFYTAFNRTCFGLGLAWVMYVCLTDQGGFINSILSFKLFIPLSRLTYCAYLVHPPVMYLYLNSMRSLLDFSHLSMLVHYLGFLVMSYSAAFITSLLFESPVIRLEKFIRTKLSAK